MAVRVIYQFGDPDSKQEVCAVDGVVWCKGEAIADTSEITDLIDALVMLRADLQQPVKKKGGA